MPAAKYSLKSPDARKRFKQAVLARGGDWQEKTEQYCDYRLDGKSGGGWIRAKQFSNGTLYLESSTDAGLAEMSGLLDGTPPVAAKPKSSGGTPVSPTLSKPMPDKVRGLLDITGTYIGTDESGKGDYFGPLVIAGVLVDDRTAAILMELGVCDSKKLTDKQISELYKQIVEVVTEKAISTVVMGPAKYNELYTRFKTGGKNLNHLLAWGHATVIETLAVRYPDCKQAIADQFGSEHYIQQQLKEKGKLIKLYQTPKAEANVGVAAASIVARHNFVRKMWQLSDQFGIKLSFGANPIVKSQAKQFIAQHGRENLKEIAKLHFKTTLEL